MIRGRGPSSEVTTSRSRPRLDQPIVKNRTSTSECSASNVTRESSLSRTDSASKNDTPCLRMLIAFFSSSQSYFDTPRTLPIATQPPLTPELAPEPPVHSASRKGEISVGQEDREARRADLLRGRPPHRRQPGEHPDR